MPVNEKPPARPGDNYYDVNEYVYPDFEGIFKGELAYTMWGKRRNKIAFVNLEDGRKIACSIWNRETNFFNLMSITISMKVFPYNCQIFSEQWLCIAKPSGA